MQAVKTTRGLAIASLVLYVASFTQTAFTYNDFDGPRTFTSLTAFISGMVSILGGGVAEWLCWLANPLYLTAAILLLCKKRIALYFGTPAALLSLWFLFWNEVLAAENGRMAPIASRNAGYFLWLLSMLLLWAGAVYFGRRRETQTGHDL